MNGTTAYALSKQYVADTADQLGSLKGAPCTIKSITEVDGGQKVTFEWTGTSGTKQTSEMTVKNGVSVTEISDKGNGTFTLLLSDGSESEPIHTVKGDPFTYSDFTAEQLESLRGEKGYSPTITENADNTDSIYKLDVTTADGTFTTPNLKGTNENGDTSNVQLDETLTDNTKAAPAGMVGEMKKDISSLSDENAELTQRLNALADSDDTTLDQMSEVVAYIKSNKSLIDAITTSKINVADIIDNLTTNVSNKPLSAAQGVALKALIDGITIPEKLPNPQKLTFTGAVTAEYDGSGAVTVTIPEGSGGSGGTVRIEKLSTDTAVELEPNKLYIFPEMAELTITLAEPTDTSIVSEYHFVFQSGATATTLSIPDMVKVPDGFTVDANKIYEISILEGCLCAQSWAVS